VKLDAVADRCQEVTAALGQVIVGKTNVLQQVLAGILANGHILIEDYPGLAKTLIARLVAQTLDLGFKRIQFTPDLLPSDITGSFLYDQREARFEFRRGPIFTNLLLADEINRATPKTQSALLESMQEHTVTVAGKTHRLPEPFFVMATQNPLEMEGTYPLPEAQLDRFFFKLLVPFPRFKDMESILDRTTEATTPRAEPIFDAQRIIELSRLVRQIPIASEIRSFAVAVVMATHPEHELATLERAVAPAAPQSDAAAAEVFIRRIDSIRRAIAIPERLSAVNVRREQIPALVTQSRGNSMSGNPRDVSDEELTQVFEDML